MCESVRQKLGHTKGFPGSWIATVFALASVGFLPIITLQCILIQVRLILVRPYSHSSTAHLKICTSLSCSFRMVHTYSLTLTHHNPNRKQNMH